jgi:hypothetical protein
MHIKEIRSGQRVRIKSTGKEYIVKGTAYPFNSFMSNRLVALHDINGLVRPSELELLEEANEE